MFTAILEKRMLLLLQNVFRKKLEDSGFEECAVSIGHPGGSWADTVYYSQKLDMWWLLDTSRNGNRYWNAFGLGRPDWKVNIAVEINYPIEGFNRRVSGNWVVDEDGNYFLFHSGDITIGKTGEGKARFKSRYFGEFCEIDIAGKIKESALIGGLDDANFIWQVRHFVQAVYSIKRNEKVEKPVDDHKFRHEFDAPGFYHLPEKVTRNANHGLIVNALYDSLIAKGFKVANNGKTGRVDLYLFDTKGDVTQMFEIKTGLSIQHVATAIGQLLLYSFPLPRKPKLTFVCPNKASERIRKLLESLGISILYFKISEGKTDFLNLDDVI